MNLSMTVGQADFRLLHCIEIRYTQSTLVASCVWSIVSIATCESAEQQPESFQ